MNSSESESAFHLFCADLDAAAVNLSNFPYFRLQFHESPGTPEARKILSKAPIYMPNVSENMLVIHGKKDDTGDEDAESDEHRVKMAAFPSHYWLGDYETHPPQQGSPKSHILANAHDVSAADGAIRDQGLLENDRTVVGYSY